MTRALALICCAGCFLLSHTAAAKPKIALTQIEGDASGDVRDAVAEALEGKELSLIGSREVNRAVDKLGDLSDLTEKDFKKIASELEADAIVAGKLDKIGSAKTLRFRLFVHKKMAKGFTVSFKDAKSEKFRSMLHDKMIDKIGLSAGGDDAEDDARPAKKKKAADDEEDPLASKAKKAKKAKADKAEEEDAAPAKKAKPTKADKADKAEPEDDARPAKKAKAAKADKADKAEEEDAAPARKKSAEPEDDARPARKAKAEAKAETETARPAEADAGSKSGDDDDAPRKAKKQVAAADDAEEVEASAVGPSAEPRTANHAAIRLDIGGSVVQRSFKFNTATFTNKPKNVSIKPVPGARLDGEAYPLLLSGSQGPLANLGVGFEYDRTLSLNLTAVNPNNKMSYTVPVKQSHFAIGLRYRLGFGKTETSSTLTAGLSYGKQLFSTDRTAVKADPVASADIARDTPESEYTLIKPGFTFRLPVTRMVAFSLGGEFLLVTGAGPIQGAASYGKARVYGGSASAALDVVVTKHIALRFAGEFTQVGYKFLGGGALSNGLDGDMTSADVGGLADRSLGGAATLAVIY